LFFIIQKLLAAGGSMGLVAWQNPHGKGIAIKPAEGIIAWD
jgi:hypothetical protein